MTTQGNSPLDPYREYIQSLIEHGYPYSQIAELVQIDKGIKTSRDSIRRAAKRWGIHRNREPIMAPGVEIFGEDSAEVTSKPSSETQDHIALIEERGLDPSDWDVDRVTINEWDSMTGETLRQLKVGLKRKTPRDLVLPARIPLEYQRPRPKLWSPKELTGSMEVELEVEPESVVFVGDQQAPFHDERLHELFLDWLSVNEPDRGVLIGDTIDLPEISRYRHNPEWTAKTQECVDAGGRILLDYVQASEGTQWIKLAGNHEERMRDAILDRMLDLHGLTRASLDGSKELEVLGIPNLLRLDELGIDYVVPNGKYEYAHVKVSPHLAACHGWIATKGAGTSALKTLDHLGYSIVMGHTHRQSHVHKTTHDINGSPSTLAAVETGCMCRIEDGLGYAVAPDWQNGFATATIWPTGKFKLDLATYVNDTLYYRDQRYV